MCERQTTLINVVVQTCCVAVARSTVSEYNLRVMEAIVQKIGIPPFPLDDEERLEELSKGGFTGSRHCAIANLCPTPEYVCPGYSKCFSQKFIEKSRPLSRKINRKTIKNQYLYTKI